MEDNLMNGKCKKYPKFFKVYLPQLSSEKLIVPPLFARSYADELADVAKLRVADGNVWRLGLTKLENNIFFHDGWGKFVEFYSILYGYFLVFCYKGASKFDVSIFDTSGCEVDYSVNGRSTENDHNLGKKQEDDDCFEISDISSTSKKQVSDKRSGEQAMRKSLITSLKNGCYPSTDPGSSSKNYITKRKKCKTEHPNDNTDLDSLREKNQRKKGPKAEAKICHSNDNATTLVCDHGIQVSKLEKAKKIKASSNVGQNVKTNDDDDAEHELPVKSEHGFAIIVSAQFSKLYTKMSQNGRRAFQTAKLFKPEYPFFIVILSERNFSRNALYIPAEFVRKYLYLRKDLHFLTIQDSNRREWHFKINKNGGGLDLKRGWSQFCRDNNLKKEDVCIFELINLKNIELKLSIFYAGGSTKSEDDIETVVVAQQFSRVHSNLSEKGKKAIRAAKLFKPANPCFMVILWPSSIKNQIMYVPAEFGRKYFSRYLKCPVCTIVDQCGRDWPCRLRWRSSNGLDLVGMQKFIEYQTLKEEDVCVFELINENDLRLRVSIFRAI